jgi:hypothetical protein
MAPDYRHEFKRRAYSVVPENMEKKMSDPHAERQKIIPKAIAWAEAQRDYLMAHGLPLSGPDIADARTVGVVSPEKIRIGFVTSMPLPDDDELRSVALAEGMLGPDTAGLTLGHGIFILRGHESRRLFTHEFRHVYQYERAGSMESFLLEYLDQVFTSGYWGAPLEMDARAHELR